MLSGTMSSESELPVNPAVDATSRDRLFAIAARLAEVRRLPTKPYLSAITDIANRDWRDFGMHAVADMAFLREMTLDLLRQFDAVATAARPFTLCVMAGNHQLRCGACDRCRLAHVLEAKR